ncbi:MAG: hypothetical protein VX498_03565 [Myxococcota bacterium]|nr:hypothetical protein [Myxococcota bacterium]
MNTLRFLSFLLLLGTLSLLLACQGSLNLGGDLGADPTDDDDLDSTDDDDAVDDDDDDDDDDVSDDDDSPYAGLSEGYMVLERRSQWNDELETWCEGEIELEVDVDGSVAGYADCELDWGGDWDDDDDDDDDDDEWRTVTISLSGAVSSSAEITCVVEHAVGWRDQAPADAPCEGSFDSDGWFIEWSVELQVSPWSTRELQGSAWQD